MEKLLTIKNILLSLLLIGLLTGIFFPLYLSHSSNLSYQDTLQKSWTYYKEKYIQSDGRVIDYTTPNIETTSEGMTYAMLRSVIENDQATFKKLTIWLYANMGVRNDGLFAWKWGRRSDGAYGVLFDINGQNSASDADIQAAEALLQASERWQNSGYHTKAVELIKNIYKYDTTTRGKERYIVGGNWSNDTMTIAQTTIYANPSYLQIASFRDFSKEDPANNWENVITSSYLVLNTCTFNSINSLQLPPNWCLLDKNTMTIDVQNPSFPHAYGYDAFRTMYNIALDYKKYHDQRDLTYLNKSSSTYYNNLLYDTKSIGNTYNLSTNQSTATDSLAIFSGAIANLLTTHPNEGKTVFDSSILSHYNATTGSYGINYYDSNWSWFLTYLTSDLSNSSTL